MKKAFFVFGLCVVCAVMAAAQAPKIVTVLKGFDPVELVDGREVKGEASLSVTRGRFRYLFANVQNKALFVKAPDTYQIQMGGGCGRMGSLSGEGNPDRYHVFDRRIYIFASEQCRNGFKAAPEQHLENPDAPPAGTAAEARRAKELLNLALKGFGGAVQVDALKNYQAKIKLGYKQGDKLDEYWQTETIAFPAQYRNEYDWRTSTSADVLSDGKAVSINRDGTYEREEPVKEALVRALHRQPLALLKARRQSGFVAYAAGKGKVGETEIEWLKVGYKGATSTLGLDPQTGRLLQIAYRDRKNIYGDVVKTFSDFRSVESLVLPFKIEESFNGNPQTSPIVTVDTVTLNAKLDAKLFRN
jgi:YHS domain-containing protein